LNLRKEGGVKEGGKLEGYGLKSTNVEAA